MYTCPASALRSVVLPLPDGPMTASSLPAFALPLTPWRTACLSTDNDTSCEAVKDRRGRGDKAGKVLCVCSAAVLAPDTVTCFLEEPDTSRPLGMCGLEKRGYIATRTLRISTVYKVTPPTLETRPCKSYQSAYQFSRVLVQNRTDLHVEHADIH